MEITSISFKETRTKFEEFLFALGHSKGTMETYGRMLSRLEKFMFENGNLHYSPKVGIAFCENESNFKTTSARHLKTAKLIVRRLNDFINGEFVLTHIEETEIPNCYAQWFYDFLEYLKHQGLRESSIKGHYYSCIKMLRVFHSLKIYDLSRIQPQDIYDVFCISIDKNNISASLRKFLYFLYKSSILAHDLSGLVPSVRKRKPIPSIYNKHETVELLSSIDTTQSAGKRDYAIILLALKLGIRSGDIVNLKISDLDFQLNTIEFIQKKTRVPQRMEFLPELKDAIQTYLHEGRPDTEYPNLFISIRPPFRPITVMAVTGLITRSMKRTGIDFGNRKLGGHALRMTLASELVSEKVPYEVVRKILGHEDTKSMKHYVKFDIEMLRSCALEVPSLTGAYEEYIMGRE